MAFRRKKKRLFIPWFLIFLVFGILWIYNILIEKSTEEQLLVYQPEISTELNKYELADFTPIILAIMDQESHGKGNDPMQSSESLGLKRNEIDNPHDSIKQGITHFIQMYKYGTKRNVDLDTIIQSYNMGPGYIDFVAENGSKHSEELAKAYSKKQVDKSPLVYTCGNNKFNFRYPYCFGDFTYTQKVNNRLPKIKKILEQASINYFSNNEKETYLTRR